MLVGCKITVNRKTLLATRTLGSEGRRLCSSWMLPKVMAIHEIRSLWKICPERKKAFGLWTRGENTTRMLSPPHGILHWKSPKALPRWGQTGAKLMGSPPSCSCFHARGLGQVGGKLCTQDSSHFPVCRTELSKVCIGWFKLVALMKLTIVVPHSCDFPGFQEGWICL